MVKGALLFLLLAAAPVSAQSASEGILLLAHGGAADWNARVNALAAMLDVTQPVEVAFGMASRPSIQSAIDRLVARGAKSIVAVPLFISSHSSVVTSTAYLLGLRSEMPPDLKTFAKMDHRSHGATTATAAQEREGHAATENGALDNLKPVASPSPIRMTDALNRHKLVGEILIERAREISKLPEQEAVIVVAHGPVPDEDNQKWLADMKVLVDQMAAGTAFAAIDFFDRERRCTETHPGRRY